MFFALLVSAASLVIAATGVFLVDCSSPLLDVIGGDPLQLCAGIGSLGMPPAPWMGVALMVVGVLGITGAWAPTKKRRANRADVASISALQRNLDRVSTIEPTTQPLDLDAIANEQNDEDALTALAGLIEVLREGFENAETVDGDLLETWIATLRICNDLHNSGRLETDDFKRLNSGLLDLASPSLDMAGASS